MKKYLTIKENLKYKNYELALITKKPSNLEI